MSYHSDFSPPDGATTLLFSEHQRFRQWWIWLIILAAATPVFYVVWQQMSGVLPEGGQPRSTTELLLSLLPAALMLLLLVTMRLDTQIREDGVYVRFFPFALKLKKYGWEDITKAYVRRYAPLKEYGGWGIRFGIKGKALNVSGNMGLQLELNKGKNLLIGTRKPEEIERVLAALGQLK